jgi:type I restriction enzyme, S subunit
VIGKELPSRPKLRFPEFDGDWIGAEVDWFLQKSSRPVDVQNGQTYQEIGVRSHGKGVFHKEADVGEALGDKRVFWVVPDALVLNIVFAWEQAVALTSKREEGFIASHRFPMFLPRNERADTRFARDFFLRPRGKWLLELASPGGAGRNKTLGQSNFAELPVVWPPRPEQQKIADFLGVVDERVKLLQQRRDAVQRYKQGMMQRIFSQNIRFKRDDGSAFPEWEECRLGDLLAYEQPTPYLVSSTEYDDSYLTPVLTAGKTFILGYTNETHGIYSKNLPVIIFDDFTTASKFVDFPFKAKSSAMKILKKKRNDDRISLLFDVLQSVKYVSGDHMRHWISEFQDFTVMFPQTQEQQKIADFLIALDDKIAAVSAQVDQMQAFKKGLLQQMFV